MHLRLLLTASLIATGCAFGDDTDMLGAGLSVTDRCQVDGLGTLPGGDVGSGLVRGGDTGATGAWRHDSPTHGVILATPDWILCRINGATLADFAGDAEVDGVGGYTYRVSVQDRGDGGDDVLVEGAPGTETLRASRFHRPTRFIDATLAIAGDAARVTIPASLPVVVGAPGNGMAVLSFTREDTGDTISCRYHGNGRRGRGGDAYELRHCVGLHGMPPVVAGDAVDVVAMSLRVQNSDSTSPGCTIETTVSVELDVVPLSYESPERDVYRIAVFAPDGSDFLDVGGTLASGDFTVTTFD